MFRMPNLFSAECVAITFGFRIKNFQGIYTKEWVWGLQDAKDYMILNYSELVTQKKEDQQLPNNQITSNLMKILLVTPA